MLVPRIPPDFSGAGRTAVRMFDGFLAMKADVSLLTYTRDPILNERVDRVRSWSWRHRLPTSNPLRKPLTALSAVAAVAEMSFLLFRMRPNVVHHMGSDFGPQLVSVAAQLLGVPVVAETTLMGSDDPVTIQKSQLGAFRHGLLKRCAAVVSVSPRLHAAALQSGLSEDKCHIIGNDVDIDAYAPPSDDERHRLRSELGIEANAVVVTSIGRLTPRKGMLELAESFARDVLPKHPNTQLLLIGPSDPNVENADYGRRLANLAANTQPPGAIRLVGEVEEAAPWLRASDVFAFASREEGFGTVVAEAMACGLPLALRRIPGITEFIVGDVVGAAVVENDAELGQAIKRAIALCDDSAARIELRERAIRHFSKEVVYQQYLDLFASVAAAYRAET